ncbi:MAG: DUF302 domain-containing protein [Variovorax sp.]|nr:MAG: DUF302 domain-containing protein [Variovorax sp.]
MYGFTVTLSHESFDHVVAKVSDALKGEGFGVLSDIDVRRTMRDELGVDMPAYRILGVCHPQLAHRALKAEPNIGLLLPWNVIVREEAPERMTVGFLNPQTMVGLASSLEIQAVADEAEQRLRRAAARLYV